jgi:autotransporter-associated beta strand protein
MKTSTSPLKVRLFATLLAIFPLLAQAANLTWDANTSLTGAQDGSGVWDTTTTSWWTGSANAAFNNVTPDVPTFGAAGGTAGTVTLGANITPGNIAFNAPTVGTYTIAGGGFTLFLTNRTLTVNAANATISAPIAIGPLSIANATANAPSAVLTLTGANSYTNFNLGANAANTTAAVRVGANNALGVPNGGINIGGGQGNITSHRIEITGGVAISNNVTVAGRNISSAAIVNLSSGNTLAGTWTRTSGGADLAIESVVANGLTLSGANGNGIALASQAGAPRNYILRGVGGGTISGVISNGSAANNLGIVKTGPGTWTFSGANTYTNGTIVDDGTLNLDYSTQNNSKLADQGPLTLGGGTVNLSGGSHTEVVFSTTILGGNSTITRSSGTSTLRLNAITRNRGGVINFGAASIADTDTANVNGILGGYATVAGADWAINSTGGADGPIIAYTGYTDIAASGSTIADAAASNVRLNSAGGGGNITLGASPATINTLLQNTSTAATIDTTSSILRLGAIGGVLLTPWSQSLTIGTATDAGTLTAGGADNTAGELVFINNSANPLTVNSTITDNGSGVTSMTKAGSGTVTLNGNNTYSGSNVVAGGTLNISSDANLGTAPGALTAASIIINGGVLNATATFSLNANRGIALGPTSRYGNGTISVAAGQKLSYLGTIANADTTGNSPGGSLTKAGPGTLELTGTSTYTFGTIINGGTLAIIQSANVGAQPGCYIPDHLVINGGTLEAEASLTLGSQRGIMLGPVGAAGVGTFQVDDSMTLELDSRITDNWNGTGSLAKIGNGILVVTGGVNDYSGDTTVSAGTLQLNNSRALPNGTGKGNVVVNGTLAITNGANPAVNGLSGSGIVDNISSSLATFSAGNNNQSSSFGGTIQNSGGAPLTFAKAGSGTLTLAGSANHNGSTLVTAGTLALSGSATIGSTTNIAVGTGATFDVSGLSGGTLTLNSGQTLSGNGSIVGTINGGSGTIAPGASAGTLTIANLTLGGGNLNYDLANITTVGAGVNDLTVVTGQLNIAGATTLNLNYLNGVPAASGKYTLIQYSSFAGSVNNISVPSGFTITNNTATKTIDLLVNHLPTSLVWRGDGAGDVWDIDTTANWIQSGTNQYFFNGDTANFDDSGSNSPPVFISQAVIAAAVNVNASQNYDFTGSAISSTALSKGGSGALILENDNTYSVGTSIGIGTLQIGNGGAGGTLTTPGITNNGALVVDTSTDILLTGPISGSGSVSEIGAGTLALSGSNSYAGATVVSTGRLYARNTFAFGDTNVGTTVAGGAQIYIDQNINFVAEPLTLNGSGLNFAGDGALRKGGAGVTTFAGPISLGSDTTINIDGGATLNLPNTNGISGNANLSLTGGSGSVGTVAGPINLGGGGGVLTKTGLASWTLSGSNSMSLATVDNGTLILANNNALGTNLNVVLTSTTGGAGLTGTRLTLSGGITIPADRSLSMPSSGAGTVRSTFFGTGANLTNTWAGTVTLFGDGSSANNLGFGADANSTFVISGNVTADSSFTGKLLMRGNATGTGIISGTLTLNASTGQIQTDDGSTWIFTSNANTWTTNIVSGSSTMKLGINNALPTGSYCIVGNGAANRLDLAGFNQQLAGLDIAAGGILITNSSPGSDSTLTYSGATSSYGGFIGDGQHKLNLTLAAGTIALTNPLSLNLTRSTVSIASGAVLELDYVGTNVVNALVLNGASQPAGLYNILNASPYVAGVGNLLVQPGPSGPAQLTNTISGNTLSFSWPAGQGWRLQALTNSSGVIGTNWVYLTDGSVNSTNVPISQTNPAVFFRLRYP